MTDTLLFGGATLASYVLGSIPFGYIVAKANGVDIRSVGSGNIGATNVFRSISKGWGLFTFACDFLKGLLPVILFSILAARLGFTGPTDGLKLLCAVGAIAGHNWPVFLHFKGGKGVATSAGAVLGIAPAAVGIGLLIWVAAFLVLRYVSLASMLAALTIAAGAWIMGPVRSGSSMLSPIVLSLMAVTIVVRHRANIQRLLSGTENRFSFRKKGKPE
ncbi:MAG: glycerol-3-phosphate 1-O-acyltransferase PlsY [Kiritimatiellia bacterium]|jgi:glycerol-3-phosphate acyltransferase PlsY|nr:glycerol-3-phosphate 1-O-acyltransferase PlsY [Kiritimatiellia bacterium]MDP6631536.1 glycerol-3-phosphate 1-O-acyltransferase PlsY [Kiritimatiellia bacterium]MDP6810596.1 glycerol-3-phosphate 1-O-acyltransferase PlsY [Kiritimatiellia bacterium]MDP7022817.1 glycerol-3-phosphate 1-O-acyltransferase PlsY [Kiritimatiellia bacterium]